MTRLFGDSLQIRVMTFAGLVMTQVLGVPLEICVMEAGFHDTSPWRFPPNLCHGTWPAIPMTQILGLVLEIRVMLPLVFRHDTHLGRSLPSPFQGRAGFAKAAH